MMGNIAGIQWGALCSGGGTDPADLPQITQDPVDTVVDEFEVTQMSVTAASGDGSALTYQWQVNFREHPESGDVWQNVQDTVLVDFLSGWDTGTLNFDDATRIEDASYRVRVYNSSGSTLSDEAKLDVIQDPLFFGTMWAEEAGQNFGYRSDFNGQSPFGAFFGLPSNTLLSGLWWNLDSPVLILETKGYEQNGETVIVDLRGFGEVTLDWNVNQNRYRFDYNEGDPMDDYIQSVINSSRPFLFFDGEFGEVTPPVTHTMTIRTQTGNNFAGYQRGSGDGVLTPDDYSLLGVNNNTNNFQIVARPDLGVDLPQGSYARFRILEDDAPIGNTQTIPRLNSVDYRDPGNQATRDYFIANEGREISIYCECFDSDGNVIFPPEVTYGQG